MVSEREIDPFIEQIAGELKRPVRFDSSFESRVMAAIDPATAPRLDERRDVRAGSTSWLLRPRPFYVSPLAGLAVAAGLVAVITMSVLRTTPSPSVASNGMPPVDGMMTPVAFDPNGSTPAGAYAAPFTYINANARSVAVVGSFNDWDASRNVLANAGDSVFSGNIMLPPGRYEYQLVVDGKWMPDPTAQRSADSDFGGTNSVLIVSPVPR